MAIDLDNLPAPTFVNMVSVNGFMNGVVNMSLGVQRWYPSPNADGTMVVEADELILVDLRFDLFCAQQMRDALDRIISENTKPAMTN